jgi:hypothetical protein
VDLLDGPNHDGVMCLQNSVWMWAKCSSLISVYFFGQISSALLAYSEPPTAPGVLRALFAGAMPADGAEALPLW